MTIDSAVFLFAGIVHLIGVALCVFFDNTYWLLLNVFVSMNMVQASFTGFCPPALLLRKLGVTPGPAFFKNAKDPR